MAVRRTQNTLPNWSSALRFMESPLSFFRMHWDHEPRDVPRRTESADKSDALQTLRAVRRRPAVAKRLECVRPQRRFPEGGCNSMAGSVHGKDQIARASFPANFRSHFGEIFDKRPKLLKSSPDVTTGCPNTWRRSARAFRHAHPRQRTRLSAAAPRAKLPGYLGRTPRLAHCRRRARIATDALWRRNPTVRRRRHARHPRVLFVSDGGRLQACRRRAPPRARKTGAMV